MKVWPELQQKSFFKLPQTVNIPIVFMVIVGLFSSGCTNLFFAPMKKHLITPEQINKKVKLQIDDWYIPVDKDIQLHAWFLVAENPKGSVLFLHGNGQNISTHIASVFWLPEQGYNVLLYDYRGYGYSQGVSSLENSVADFPTVLRYLYNKDPFSQKKLVVFAQSLGGAIALNGLVHTPKDITVDAAIIDSAFTGFRRIARQKLAQVWFTWPLQWPLSLTITNKYAPVKQIARLSQYPVLIIHGTGDRVIPYHHGESLYEAANEPKYFWTVQGGRHIDFVGKPQNRQKLIQFLSALKSR